MAKTHTTRKPIAFAPPPPVPKNKILASQIGRSRIPMQVQDALKEVCVDIHKAHIMLLTQRVTESNRLDRAAEDLTAAEVSLCAAADELFLWMSIEAAQWISRVSACEGLVRMAADEIRDRFECGDHIEGAFDLLIGARKKIRSNLGVFQEFARTPFTNDFHMAGSCSDWGGFAGMWVQAHRKNPNGH